MRMERPKTLFEVGGKPMLRHILDRLEKVPACLPPIIIVGFGKEEIISYVGDAYTCVEQKELTGTATAVKTALPYIPKEASAVLVLYGDHPFIRVESIEKIADAYETEKPAIVQTFITIPHFEKEHEIFKAFGRLVRNGRGELEKIVEYKNATDEEKEIKEVNPGLCAIDTAWLNSALPKIQANKNTGEYYLTDLISLAAQEGKRIVAVETSMPDALGVNSPEDARRAEEIFKLHN